MLKLTNGFRFFLSDTIVIGAGVFYILYSIIINPDEGIMQLSVLYGAILSLVGILVLIVKLIWSSAHTLKFNTKRFVVKGVTYTYDQIEKFDMGGYENKSRHIYIYVDGEEIFYFNRRYRNFFEFKAVLKEHGHELTYY